MSPRHASRAGLAVAAATAVTAALALAGCSTENGQALDRRGSAERSAAPAAPSPSPSSTPTPAADCRPVDVGALRAGGAYDYEPRTPAEALAASDLVVVAELVRIVDGFDQRDDGDRVPYLVAELAITERIGGRHPDAVPDGVLRMPISQGPVSVESGEPSFGIERFRRSLPAGTRMLLFVNDATADYDSPPPALPPGTRLYGGRPDGVLVDSCGALAGGHDELLGAWRSYRTLDDLRAALRTLP
ncbi:hypothetical protein [Pimelobacter simplex]|uniref:hypothetical protein n=1 Tax=Nocardioides simplex TaxID=2045 RepID=UPI003AAC99D4